MKKNAGEGSIPKKAGVGAAGEDAGKVIPMPTTEPKALEKTGAAPVRTVDTVTLEIVTLKRQAGRVLMGYAIEIGRRLVEVKEMLPHGEWGTYLRERVEYSQSTAENFMRLFREYGETQQSLFGAEPNSQTLANLPYSKALALLALPAGEREAFAEENDVEAMSTRELQAALRAREEAEAQARTAEEARAVMEHSMKVVNENMAAAREEAEAARRDREEAEARAAELARRLEELEQVGVHEEGDSLAASGPLPVDKGDGGTLDPAELDKARAEGRREAEKGLREKLAAAERERAQAVEKAREELKAARAAAKEAKEAGKSKDEALRLAREEAERLKKALAVAGNKEIAAFQVCFENTQKDFSMMVDRLAALKKAGDRENHDKLVGAVTALLEALKERVPERMGRGEAL